MKERQTERDRCGSDPLADQWPKDKLQERKERLAKLPVDAPDEIGLTIMEKPTLHLGS